jgi:hypothetical protein
MITSPKSHKQNPTANSANNFERRENLDLTKTKLLTTTVIKRGTR